MVNHLKFYERESMFFQTFPEAKTKLENKEAKKLALKLARHFHINLDEIRFRRGKYSFALLGTGTIIYHNNPSIENICHELGHLYVSQNVFTVKRFHTKKLWKAIEKLLKYCRKKNYWRD
jgi:hypothetical protein